MTSPFNPNGPATQIQTPQRLVFLDFPRDPTSADTKYRDGSFYKPLTVARNTAATPPRIWMLAGISGTADWRLISGTAPGNVNDFTVDAFDAPATSTLVEPNGIGNVILTAARIATGTVAAGFRSFTNAANTATYQIQEAGANAATPTANNYGISQYDSNQFDVTAGFVQLKGGGTTPAMTKALVDTGPGANPVVADATGQIQYRGQTLTGSGIQTFTDTANRVSLQMFSPFTQSDFVFSRSDNNQRLLRVQNLSAGTAARGAVLADSDAGTFGIFAHSSTYTGLANRAVIQANGFSDGFDSQSTSGIWRYYKTSGADLIQVLVKDGTNEVRRTLSNATNGADTSSSIGVSSTSGGDPFSRWSVNGGEVYAFGIDNSDSDKLKITNGTVGNITPSGGTELYVLTAAGEHTYPLQPAFNAYNASNITGISHSASLYTVTFDTELFDRGADFAANTFTAPVTGVYEFQTTVTIQALNGATRFEGNITTTTRRYRLWEINPTATIATGTDSMTQSGGVYALMSAGDTAIVQIIVDGGGAVTFDLGGSASVSLTHFSGKLVA